MSGSGVLTIPGLGRPFDLGMLYDCRSDTLVPDFKLWNEENLGKDIISHPYQTSHFSISAEDTIESKYSALGVEACVDLKLSVLGGLVPVSGSAEYFNDRKTSDRQTRATLIFKCTTKFEELTISHLGRENVHKPAVFDEGTATHVVTGVTYGARAFFVFDKQLSNKDMEKNIEDELLVMVKALPSMGIDGQGSLRMSEDNAKKFDNLQVAFYGDFQPSPPIMSVADAVKLFKDFPSQLLGHKEENAVPVEVWLYPLEKLDSKAARLVREISANLVIDVENCVEEFYILRRRCNDLGRRPACQNFPQIKKKLDKFGKTVKEYKSDFMQQLKLILPKIRGGDEKESNLRQLFVRKEEESPFSYRLLKQWLDNCEEQINLMEKYTSCMGVKIAGDFSGEILNGQIRFCVCFRIRLPTDQLIPEMKRYLLECNNDSFKPSKVSVSESSLHDEVGVGFARNARRFIDFRLANADRQDISFVLAEDTSMTSKKTTDKLEGSIQLHYQYDGKLIAEDFKPPSKPEKPNATSSAHDALSISWQRPEEEVITEYTVSYRISGSSNWLTRTSSSECFDLRDLTAGTSYEVKVAALCKAGASLYSDVNVIKTRPTNPTSKPNVWQASMKRIMIEWERPTIIGNDILVKSYDIERRLELDQDGGMWMHCGDRDGNTLAADISQERDSAYRYRIIVNCGGERSNPSAESDVIIIHKKTLKEQLRCQSRKIKTYKQPSVFQVPLSEVTVDSTNMIRKFSLGEITPCPEKVLLIVGATRAGKSTFLNGILNYVLGVKWEDRYRFRLVDKDDASKQTESQTERVPASPMHDEDNASNRTKSRTEWVTAYTLHHQEGLSIPYTLTVIDTPGFGHEARSKRNKQTTEHIRDFFSKQVKGGIDHIDAVGFVTQSSIPMLYPSQGFIFDSIRSLFHADIAENIFPLLMSADGQERPESYGVDEAQRPYSKSFMFNNSALFAPNSPREYSEGYRRRHEWVSFGGEDYDTYRRRFDEMISIYEKFLNQLSKLGAKACIKIGR